MPLDLRQQALFHTNGRLGLFFSQTTIEVVEVHDLCADVEVEEELCADISCSVDTTP